MKLNLILKILLIILPLAVSLSLAILSLKTTDFTIDETNYLGNSYNLVRKTVWDTSLIRNHPPLIFYLHGLPSLFINSTNPWQQLFYARLSNLLLFVLLGLAIFFITQKTYGFKAGLLALVLLCFNPEIIAHGRLMTFDLALALFILLYLFYFILFLEAKKKSVRLVIINGIILGLLLLTKYNALSFIPISLLLLFLYDIFFTNNYKKILKIKSFQIVIIFFIAIFMVNLGYGFKNSFNIPDKFFSKQFQFLKNNAILKNSLAIFPAPFLQGADWQLNESQKKWYWNFFLGQRSTEGFPYFYFLTFLFKTPIPLLMFLIIAIILLIKNGFSKSLFFDFASLIIISYGFIHFSFFNNLNIGFRYLLFIYPLLIIFVSRIINFQFSNIAINCCYKAFIVFLLGWYILGFLKIHPYYLAYANEFIGGPKNAWKYWSDSTLDWWQDNRSAHEYLIQHPKIIINPKKTQLGKFAVSVYDMTYGGFEDYEWVRKLKIEPVDNIGYTWLIFEITEQDLNKL